MKCPKCHYLGFETSDRCRNCGYDFSLSPLPPADPAVVEPPAAPLVRGQQGGPAAPPLDSMPPSLRRSAAGRPNAAGTPAWPAPPLPLFSPAAEEDDAPLVTLPAQPRVPLSVRRTPDQPRLRTPQRVHTPPRPPEPVLAFTEDTITPLAVEPPRPASARGVVTTPSAARQAITAAPSSGSVRRLAAALIDQSILLGIDAIVVYFTLRMAALDTADWALLPALPLLLFLAMISLGYFIAFTVVGGQTIGKMSMHIRVVSDDAAALDGARAMRRALAGIVSVLTCGLAFVPALTGDRRALHDKVARTRVVALDVL